MRCVALFLCLASASLAALGCGPSGPVTYKVSGTVSFNDEPLPDGVILFIPEEKNAGTEGGTIKDGRYEMRAKKGMSRVEIRAHKKTTDPPKGAMAPPRRVQYLPERYNARSDQTADVAPNDDNRFDFSLRDRPSPGK